MPDLMQFMRERENRYRGIGPKKSESVRRRLNLGTGLQDQPVEAPSATQSPILDRSPGQPGGPSTDAVQATGSVGVSGTNLQSLMDSMLKSSQEFYRQQQDRQRSLLMEQLLAPATGATLQPLGSLGAGTGVGTGAGSNQVQRPEGGNGRLPDNMLVDVGGGHRLQPAAAAAWNAMVAAAAADGVSLTIGDSYRSYEEQVAVAAEKGLYSQGGLAAEPGTSQHGWGLAVDVGEGPQREWLAQHGHEFGFDTIPREPWHWQYEG